MEAPLHDQAGIGPREVAQCLRHRTDLTRHEGDGRRSLQQRLERLVAAAGDSQLDQGVLIDLVVPAHRREHPAQLGQLAHGEAPVLGEDGGPGRVEARTHLGDDAHFLGPRVVHRAPRSGSCGMPRLLPSPQPPSRPEGPQSGSWSSPQLVGPGAPSVPGAAQPEVYGNGIGRSGRSVPADRPEKYPGECTTRRWPAPPRRRGPSPGRCAPPVPWWSPASRPAGSGPWPAPAWPARAPRSRRGRSRAAAHG